MIRVRFEPLREVADCDGEMQTAKESEELWTGAAALASNSVPLVSFSCPSVASVAFRIR